MTMLPTWDQVRARINGLALASGEWAGAPLPVPGIPLVVEPRYPFAGLDGYCLDDGEPRWARAGRSGDDGPPVRVRNSWYSVPNSATVYVCDDGPGTPVFHVMLPEWGGKRLGYWMGTIGASRAWSVDAEMRAVETLRGLVTPQAWESYVLTGSFLETSRRSGVMYLFRKLRPTIALRGTAAGDTRILAALCLHPIGYYEETWAGVMVPSDDVIAHLMLMRGCEAKFWGKANHHPIWAASAGI